MKIGEIYPSNKPEAHLLIMALSETHMIVTGVSRSVYINKQHEMTMLRDIKDEFWYHIPFYNLVERTTTNKMPIGQIKEDVMSSMAATPNVQQHILIMLQAYAAQAAASQAG